MGHLIWSDRLNAEILWVRSSGLLIGCDSLNSGADWEYVHVAIDDHSRIAFSAVYPDEKQASVLNFLHAALAYYLRLGIAG
jgi:hypothetical protein